MPITAEKQPCDCTFETLPSRNRALSLVLKLQVALLHRFCGDEGKSDTSDGLKFLLSVKKTIKKTKTKIYSESNIFEQFEVVRIDLHINTPVGRETCEGVARSTRNSFS